MDVGGGGRAEGRGAEESVGIVGIEVPIILYTQTRTHQHARAHASCQSRYINAQ